MGRQARRATEPESDQGGTATRDWAPEIDAWLRYLKGSGKPPTTLYLRRYHMRRVATALAHRSPWDVTVDDLADWLSTHDWAPETRRSYRSSMCSFWTWAHRTGRTGTNPAGLLDAVPVPQGRPRPAPEHVLRQALESTERADVRLMILLAARAGLRRGEIARVHRRDLQHDHDGPTLRVLGKGRKVRVIPLLDEVAELIAQRPDGWVFPGRTREGHRGAESVGELVSKALGPDWTAHTLRHRFASRAYLPERDIRAVQELLGHASVRTTQTYTAVPADALRSAIRGAA